MNSTHDFGVGFAADWDELAQGDGVRALAVDAMRNAAYALERLAGGPERDAIAEQFHLVRVAAAAEPGAKMQDGVLVISYAPEGGPSARPSSRAIGRVLAEAFKKPTLRPCSYRVIGTKTAAHRPPSRFHGR